MEKFSWGNGTRILRTKGDPGDDELGLMISKVAPQEKSKEKPHYESEGRDKYALPLCLRKLAARNNDIHTYEQRRTIRKAYKDGNGKWVTSPTEYIEPEPPRFLPTQCIRRVIWRVVTLDSRIPKKIAYLFTLVGTVVVTLITTLMYGYKDIKVSQMENQDTKEAFRSWADSLWLILLALALLAVLDFINYVYHILFIPQQQLLKETRFNYAIQEYTQHNYYSGEYVNEYNGANDQDPDAVIMWMMDLEEQIEHDPKKVTCCASLCRNTSRFCLCPFIQSEPDNVDVVNKGCYSCCCFRSYKRTKRKN